MAAMTAETSVPAAAPMPIDVSRGRRPNNGPDAGTVAASDGHGRRLPETSGRRMRMRFSRTSSLPKSVFDSPAGRHPGMPSRHSSSPALISPRRTSL
jgi:hypothetical protein